MMTSNRAVDWTTMRKSVCWSGNTVSLYRYLYLGNIKDLNGRKIQLTYSQKTATSYRSWLTDYSFLFRTENGPLILKTFVLLLVVGQTGSFNSHLFHDLDAKWCTWHIKQDEFSPSCSVLFHGITTQYRPYSAKITLDSIKQMENRVIQNTCYHETELLLWIAIPFSPPALLPGNRYHKKGLWPWSCPGNQPALDLPILNSICFSEMLHCA